MVDTMSGSNEKTLAFLGELSEFYELPVAQPTALTTKSAPSYFYKGYKRAAWSRISAENP